jgi:hypothetical protein
LVVVVVVVDHYMILRGVARQQLLVEVVEVIITLNQLVYRVERVTPLVSEVEGPVKTLQVRELPVALPLLSV